MHEKRQLTLREHNVQGSKIERIDIQKPDSGTYCLTRIQVTVSEGIGGQAAGLPIV